MVYREGMSAGRVLSGGEEAGLGELPRKWQLSVQDIQVYRWMGVCVSLGLWVCALSYTGQEMGLFLCPPPSPFPTLSLQVFSFSMNVNVHL